MGDAQRGRKRPLRPKEWTHRIVKSRSGNNQWIQKQRESHLGQVPWNKGLKGWHQSEETKKKRSLAQLGGHKSSTVNYHKPKSETHKQNLQKAILAAVPRGENHHCWKGGTSFIPYCYKFNGRRKQAVRSFFGFRCIACGISQDENLIAVKRGMKPVKLAVHHIDHDKEQGCNGKPFNLVAFCNSCHSLEGQHEEEYRLYVNRVLQDGFDWGIWSEQDYLKNVMYDE